MTTAAEGALLIRVKEVNGERRTIGYLVRDTLYCSERDPKKHGFRGGADTWAKALAQKSAAWGIDLEVIETLTRDHGLKYVEIPTPARRYRATTELLLGPKSYTVEYNGHRRQTVLNLDYWTALPK